MTDPAADAAREAAIRTVFGSLGDDSMVPFLLRRLREARANKERDRLAEQLHETIITRDHAQFERNRLGEERDRLAAENERLRGVLADLVAEIETDGGVDTSAWSLLDAAKAALDSAQPVPTLATCDHHRV